VVLLSTVTDCNNVNLIVSHNQCVGCGVCAAVCPTNAIRIIKSYNFLAEVEIDACVRCGLCLKICPSVEKKEDYERAFSSIFDLVGDYKEILLAGPVSQNLETEGSSGGLVTSILVSAFKKKLVDGALIVGNYLEFPKYGFATSIDQILNGLGSKYLIAPLDKSLKDLSNLNGRYAVVALPCQVRSLRRLIALDSDLKTKIVLIIGLFCGRGLDLNGVSLLKKLAGTSGDIISFVRKGRSSILVIVKEQNGIVEYSVPFEKWAKYTLSSYFFTPPGCFFCSDHTGEKADISFGDAWQIEKKNKKSIIISRTEIGASHLENAVRSNSIEIEKISPRSLIYSQSNQLYFHKVTTRIIKRSSSYWNSVHAFSIFCTVVILSSNIFYRFFRNKSNAIPIKLARIAGLVNSFLKKIATNKYMLKGGYSWKACD
jgi:coenzyme F420 hydrogenase subunit beta